MLVLLALLGAASGFAPHALRSPLLAQRAVGRPSLVPRPSTATAPPPTLAGLSERDDETFPGVADCPFTAWGPRNVRVKEERASPRCNIHPEPS